jgi:hypothetical protein
MDDILQILDQLDQLGVDLQLLPGTGPGPRLRANSPAPLPADISAAVRTNRTLITNTLIGRITGHAPAPCDHCGRVSFVPICTSGGRPRSSWPTCRLTPGCAGRHVARDVDIARTNPTAPPTQAPQPPNAGKKVLLGPWPPWPDRGPS